MTPKTWLIVASGVLAFTLFLTVPSFLVNLANPNLNPDFATGMFLGFAVMNGVPLFIWVRVFTKWQKQKHQEPAKLA